MEPPKGKRTVSRSFFMGFHTILTLYTISPEILRKFMFLHLHCFHFTGFRYVTIIHPWGTATGLLINLTEPISRWFNATESHPVPWSRVELFTSNRVFVGWVLHLKSRIRGLSAPPQIAYSWVECFTSRKLCKELTLSMTLTQNVNFPYLQ